MIRLYMNSYRQPQFEVPSKLPLITLWYTWSVPPWKPSKHDAQIFAVVLCGRLGADSNAQVGSSVLANLDEDHNMDGGPRQIPDSCELSRISGPGGGEGPRRSALGYVSKCGPPSKLWLTYYIRLVSLYSNLKRHTHTHTHWMFHNVFSLHACLEATKHGCGCVGLGVSGPIAVQCTDFSCRNRCPMELTPCVRQLT